MMGRSILMLFAKADYQRRDPRTGKTEEVHDSRSRHEQPKGEARPAASAAPEERRDPHMAAAETLANRLRIGEVQDRETVRIDEDCQGLVEKQTGSVGVKVMDGDGQRLGTYLFKNSELKAKFGAAPSKAKGKGKAEAAPTKVVRPPVMGEGKNKARIEATLAALPDAHFALMTKMGGHLTVRNSTRVEVGGKDAHGARRGTGANSLVEIADGFADGMEWREALDVEGTTTHEIGHVLDAVHQGALGEKFSEMVGDESDDLTDDEFDCCRYYVSNSKERFAELYRAAFAPEGATAFRLSLDRARSVFAKSIAALKKEIGT